MKFEQIVSEGSSCLVICHLKMVCYEIIPNFDEHLTSSVIYNFKMTCDDIVEDDVFLLTLVPAMRFLTLELPVKRF